MSLEPAPTARAPTRPLLEFPELALGATSLNDHRMAIFAHEVANSLSVIGFSLEYFKSEFKARQIDDPVVNRVMQSALAEIAGLGIFLHKGTSKNSPLKL